jgi:hypothetical protein
MKYDNYINTNNSSSSNNNDKLHGEDKNKNIDLKKKLSRNEIEISSETIKSIVKKFKFIRLKKIIKIKVKYI